MNGAMAFKEPIIMKPTAMRNVKQQALIGSSLGPLPFANGFNIGNKGSLHTA